MFRMRKQFKYCDIDFSIARSDSAYHLNCYRTFAVLKDKPKEEYNMML